MPRLAIVSLLTLCGTTLAAPFTAERLFGIGDATPVGEVTALGRISINDSGEWASTYSGTFADGFSPAAVRSSTGFNILPGTLGLPYAGGEYSLTTPWDIDINPSGEVALATSAIDFQNSVALNGVILNGEARFDIPAAQSSHEFLGSPTRFGISRYVEYIDSNRIVLNTQSPDMPFGPNLGVNLISRITFASDGSFIDETMGAPDQVVVDDVSVFNVEGTSIGTRVNRAGDVFVFAGMPGTLGVAKNGELLYTGHDSVPDMPGYRLTLDENGMVDQNDNGQWVGIVTLISPDLQSERVMVRDTGEVILRALEPQGWLNNQYALPSRVDLVDEQHLIWSATVTPDLQSPDVKQTLFYNQTILLQAGVSIVDEKLVTDFSIPGGQNFEVSPSGEWIASSITFEDGTKSFYRLRIPTPGGAAIVLLSGFLSLRRRR